MIEIKITAFVDQIVKGNHTFNDFKFTENFLDTPEEPDYLVFGSILLKLIQTERISKDKRIELVFRDCVFDSIADFDFEGIENISIKRFQNCTFNNICHFRNLTIDIQERLVGNINKSIYCFFHNVIFEKVGFHKVNFKTNSIFHKTTFNDEIIFGNCVFEKDINTKDLVFKKDVMVIACTFEGVGIISSKFEKNIAIMGDDSRTTVFKQNVFILGEIMGSLQFENVDFQKDFTFRPSYQADKLFSVENVRINGIGYFRDSVFNSNVQFKKIDLSHFTFLNSKIDDALFSECSFTRGYIYDDLELKKKNIIINYNDVIKELRMFEMSFDKRKDFEQAGWFHYEAMEINRTNSNGKLKFLILTFYKWTSRYGESIERSLSCVFFTIIFFSLAYLFTGLITPHGQIWWWDSAKRYYWLGDWGYGLLYSFFSSVPFKRESDIIKSLGSWTTGLSIFQTVIQTVLGSLFLIALRRKFKR